MSGMLRSDFNSADGWEATNVPALGKSITNHDSFKLANKI